MKYVLKKWWFLFAIAMIINLPLLILGCISTDKTMILKGDTSVVEDFVEIENPYSSNGSFSTIFVISMDHSTILQNLIVGKDKQSIVSDMNDSYLHFTMDELSKMGNIQHKSSIYNSLIVAYEAANKVNSNINIEYEFDALVVSYYGPNSEFRIGDRIIGINNVYAKDDFEAFRTDFNDRTTDDVYIVQRGYQELKIESTDENFEIGGYSYYNINQEVTTPKFTLKQSNVGGPSGGLLQTLSLYNSLIEEDITRGRKIAGTGTINIDGSVGSIGGIEQKIYTAFDDKIDVFLCPEDNYEDALKAYNQIPNKEKMRLYSVSSFEEALLILENDYLEYEVA